jgi:hypothetical protein
LANELQKKMKYQQSMNTPKNQKNKSTTESDNEIGRDHHLDTSGDDFKNLETPPSKYTQDD